MDLAGEERITAPRTVVWEALNDPQLLCSCIPGCHSLQYTSPTTLDAVIKAKVGFISARFSGDVRLTDITPSERYTISAEGKGGFAGFAKGSAVVTLLDDGENTLLRYVAHAEIGGKIAQLGARLIDSTSQKFTTRFFSDLNNAISARAAQDRCASPDRKTMLLRPDSHSIASTRCSEAG